MKLLRIYDLKMIRNLAIAKNYDEIYKRYGKNIYDLFYYCRYINDVQYEGGNTKLAKFKQNFKYITIPTASIIFCFFASMPFYQLIYKNNIKKENIENINKYEEYVQKYIESENFEELTDLEIFMKVMNKQHQEMKYGSPELNLFGYFRLDVVNGVGVCRNLADDLAYRLNQINPDYNAKMIAIHIEFGDLIMNNDEIEVVSSDEPEEVTTDGNETLLSKINEKMILNHAVTMVDIPGKDYTLLLDSTNSEIGVIYNGKLNFFNSPNELSYTIDLKHILALGYDNGISLDLRELKSFFVDSSFDELNELYGLDAQNEAIKSLELK